MHPFVNRRVLAGSITLVDSPDKVLRLEPMGFAAIAAHCWIDPGHRLITIFMVQHADDPGTDGNNIQPVFTKAALEQIGTASTARKNRLLRN